jgi:hypothetical protein
MPSSESLKASISEIVEEYAKVRLQECLTQILNALPKMGYHHSCELGEFIRDMAKGECVELTPMCIGKNKKGKRCCNLAHKDTGFCRLHISQHPRFDALTSPQPTTVDVPVYDEDEDELRELNVCNTR